MYHLSYLDIKHEIYLEGEEGYNKLTPPRVSLFLSNPAGIGLR